MRIGNSFGRIFRKSGPDLGGGSNSVAFGINGSGTVVGEADASSGYRHAFSYANGTMAGLNSLTTNLPTGFVLNQAGTINSFGDIVGYGTNSAGQTEAFLLTPVPESAAITLLALGGLGLLLKRGKRLGFRI